MVIKLDFYKTKTHLTQIQYTVQRLFLNDFIRERSTTQLEIYGPYYRFKSPTQTEEDAERQLKSKELWGKPARGSSIPKVKAYTSAYPGVREKRQGIKFTTLVPPDSYTPGHIAHWSNGREGVRIEGGYAKISLLTITRYP
jgi:hypothetical protein